MKPVILHIPHASVFIPKEYRESFLCDLQTELNCMTDWYTDALFACGLDALVFPVSRLVCDVERFRDDAWEPMAQRGMGAVYTRNHLLEPLRAVDAEERERILRRWYDPHHERLEVMTGERLAAFGRCLIIDCHSYSGIPLPYEPDQSPDRPDICIGSDPFHTPPELAAKLERAFRSKGYSTALNTPFAGSLVPMQYYQKNPNVVSIMIEVSRSLYLDERFRKNDRFILLQRDLREILKNRL